MKPDTRAPNERLVLFFTLLGGGFVLTIVAWVVVLMFRWALA